MSVQVCPFHSDEDVAGVFISDEIGEKFVCDRGSGHPAPRAFEWFHLSEPTGLSELSGLAAELGLDVTLPAIVRSFEGRWVEYGAIEHTYATQNPTDFAFLVDRYGHTAVQATRFSASSFLSATLGLLQRRGEFDLRFGPATGRWAYNSLVSYWASHPAGDWEKRLSWASLDGSMDYVPGSNE